MSQPSSQTPVDSAALAREIEVLRTRTGALNAAIAQSKQIRQLLLVGLALMIAVVTWRFYALAGEFRSRENMDRLVTIAQERLAAKHDLFIKEGEKLVDEVSPVVTAAFYEQSKKDLPHFTAAIDRERKEMLDTLPAHLTERVDGHHRKLADKHKEILADEFPAMRDETVRNRLMANTVAALNRMAQRYYVKEFESELRGMYETWDAFPIAETPAPGELPLEDQIVGELMDLVALKLARTRAERPGLVSRDTE